MFGILILGDEDMGHLLWIWFFKPFRGVFVFKQRLGLFLFKSPSRSRV
ncbi:Putative protein [Zobellia galactanivorans]|uniref:Uncharacterized protein n=1 Tax=Zobellia galactanivorans (strain DSM 12802 / CCUG 47099 / CIP 106680 / NCIMB 13871 / Dsij) TaxID=63186 RepID=G0L459_ZOBGA|nr:Putative protein [Zobellia galactanivorans]